MHAIYGVCYVNIFVTIIFQICQETYAQKFSFDTKALKIGPQQIISLKLPCILHWDMNHFVVLVKVNKNNVLIYDPAHPNELPDIYW